MANPTAFLLADSFFCRHFSQYRSDSDFQNDGLRGPYCCRPACLGAGTAEGFKVGNLVLRDIFMLVLDTLASIVTAQQQ